MGLRILILSEVEIPREYLKLITENIPANVNLNISIVNLGSLKLRFRNLKRGQINAESLLNNLNASRIGVGYDKVVVVLNDDGYVEGLNFVFGIAYMNGKVAIVFTKRLHSANPYIFYQRLVKEIIHELGHTFGLSHCEDPKCVMHFSNTLMDTDLKGPGFCSKCLAKLRQRIGDD